MLLFKKRPAMPSAAEALAGRPTAIATETRHFVNGQSQKRPYPAGSDVAVFGMGCFWGAEFWQLPKVSM